MTSGGRPKEAAARGSGSVTIRDVARVANVHPGTVSRALNDETRALVNPATAKRVSEAANQLVGNQIDGIGRHRAFIQVDELHVVLSGQSLVDVAFRGQLEVLEGLAHAHILGLGVIDGFLLFLSVDDSPLDENFTQLLLMSGHGATSVVRFRSHSQRRACRSGLSTRSEGFG